MSLFHKREKVIILGYYHHGFEKYVFLQRAFVSQLQFFKLFASLFIPTTGDVLLLFLLALISWLLWTDII